MHEDQHAELREGNGGEDKYDERWEVVAWGGTAYRHIQARMRFLD